jgi:hypothetical protein
MTTTPSWFERHPRNTLFALLSSFLLVAVALTEYVLEKDLRWPPAIRYIRLRENAPLTSVTVKADRKALERQYHLFVDGLEEKPYVFRTDENGFIMPSKVYADPQLTLVFLGGSTTECFFVDEESRWPYRAGVLLGRRFDKRVNSYNGGVRGSNSLHLIDTLIHKVLPMKPDVVVFMENVNDVTILLFAGSYWNDNPSRSLIVACDVPRSRLRRLLKATADGIFPGIVHRVERAHLFGRDRDEFAMERRVRRVRSEPDKAEYEHNLVTFVYICRTRGILPVLMTQFNRLKDVPDEFTEKNMRRFEQEWGIGTPRTRASWRDSMRPSGRWRGRRRCP